MKKKILAEFMAGLLILGTAEVASSSISAYTDYSLWSASTNNIQTVAISGPEKSLTGGLTTGGVTFDGSAGVVNIISLNSTYMLSSGSWGGSVNAALPSGITSIGVYLYDPYGNGGVQISTGGQGDYFVDINKSTGTFFGLTNNTGFLPSISFTPFYQGEASKYNIPYIAIDQFSYGPGKASPVPIPSSMLLLGTGIVGFAMVGRRKRS